MGRITLYSLHSRLFMIMIMVVDATSPVNAWQFHASSSRPLLEDSCEDTRARGAFSLRVDGRSARPPTALVAFLLAVH